MDMIRHDLKHIDIHTGIKYRQFVPYPLNHMPGVVQYHFPVGDITEKALPVLGAEGHKISPRGLIIITG